MSEREARLQTFEREVLAHVDALLRTAGRIAGSGLDAEDIMQETFLRAWKYFDTFEAETNCRAWLFQIMFNVIKSRRRDLSRHPETPLEDEIDGAFQPDNVIVFDPARQIEGGEVLEAALIRRIQAGEKELFWQLAEPHYKSIHMTANTILRNPDQAADVVQEAMLKALIHIDQLNDADRFRGWLMSIVINESRMLIRKRQTVVEDPEDGSQDTEEFFPRDYADWRNIPSNELEKKEIWDAVYRALETLSPICREVFILRDIQHFSISETATILDISEANVSLRLHRSRLQMRELLAPLFRDAPSPWRPLVMMLADMPSMLMHRVVECKTAINDGLAAVLAPLHPVTFAVVFS